MTALNKQALRERYSEKIAPKCQICGAVMTIQRAGAGGVVYGCTGRIDKDGEGYKFAEGRDFADNHYALSRVTVANNYNPDVLELLDELEADKEKIKTLESRNRRLEGIIDAAEKRIAELSASHSKLREGMAAIYNAICENGASTSLSAILTFVKRSREESATAAGIGVKGE